MLEIKDIKREFIEKEQRKFKSKIGELTPTALTGFIAGVIVASFVWFLVVLILRRFM